MDLPSALTVLAALDAARVRWWLVGGWGVDALVGRPTRAHRDLDLLIDDTTWPAALTAVAGLGYEPETDWLPIRLEYAGPPGWVDLHPVAFGPEGDGVQAGPDGTTFHYPAADLVTGRLGGRVVPCGSVGLQWRGHQGYPPRDVDRHDLGLLAGLLGGLPPGSPGPGRQN